MRENGNTLTWNFLTCKAHVKFNVLCTFLIDKISRHVDYSYIVQGNKRISRDDDLKFLKEVA